MTIITWLTQCPFSQDDPCVKFRVIFSITVEPLTNDHPHLRPPAFYDRFFIFSTLFKHSLTNDHPADATNDHGNLNFTRQTTIR